MTSKDALANAGSLLTAAVPTGAMERAAVAVVWLALAVILLINEEKGQE